MLSLFKVMFATVLCEFDNDCSAFIR